MEQSQLIEIATIVVLPELLCTGLKLLLRDPSHFESHFVGRPHLLALPFCERAHEIAGVQQTGMRARVEPGKAPPHFLQAENAILEVAFQQACNFQLTAR